MTHCKATCRVCSVVNLSKADDIASNIISQDDGPRGEEGVAGDRVGPSNIVIRAVPCHWNRFEALRVLLKILRGEMARRRVEHARSNLEHVDCGTEYGQKSNNDGRNYIRLAGDNTQRDHTATAARTKVVRTNSEYRCDRLLPSLPVSCRAEKRCFEWFGSTIHRPSEKFRIVFRAEQPTAMFISLQDHGSAIDGSAFRMQIALARVERWSSSTTYGSELCCQGIETSIVRYSGQWGPRGCSRADR